MKEKYTIFCIADHGMDGFIVKTTDGTYTMQCIGEVALSRELFKGQKTIGEIYNQYIQNAKEIYDQPYYSGHIVDLVKDKPFFKLVIELANYEKNRFEAKVKIEPYQKQTFTLSSYLQQVDAADNDVEYSNRVGELFDEATYDSHLGLYYLGLGNKAAHALSDLMSRIPSNQRKKEIDFFQKKFIHEIKTVNLTNNFISDKGCQELSSGITCCKSLEVLILRENPIGNAGLMSISDALAKHPKLRELDLIDCNLTDDCMEKIGALLATSTTIETIKLSSNNITDEGVSSILDKVRSNPSIKTITLFGTNVSEQMKSCLEEAVFNQNSNAWCNQ